MQLTQVRNYEIIPYTYYKLFFNKFKTLGIGKILEL